MSRNMIAALTVAAILGLVAGLLVIAAHKVRKESARLKASSNLKGIICAVHDYYEGHGKLPAAFYRADENGPLASWRISMLPYLNGDHLYRAYQFDQPWDSPTNQALIPSLPNSYSLLGYEENGPLTDYLAVVGEQTAWPTSRRIGLTDLTDGTGETIFIVENLGEGVTWSQPADLWFDTMSFSVGSPNGISSRHDLTAVAMADGSLRYLTDDTDPAVIRALLTRAGSEDVQGFSSGKRSDAPVPGESD